MDQCYFLVINWKDYLKWVIVSVVIFTFSYAVTLIWSHSVSHYKKNKIIYSHASYGFLNPCENSMRPDNSESG